MQGIATTKPKTVVRRASQIPPAKHVGWMSEYGEKIPLPTQGEGSYTCPYTHQIYILNHDQMKRQPS
jgi:hypothetical protein